MEPPRGDWTLYKRKWMAFVQMCLVMYPALLSVYCCIVLDPEYWQRLWCAHLLCTNLTLSCGCKCLTQTRRAQKTSCCMRTSPLATQNTRISFFPWHGSTSCVHAVAFDVHGNMFSEALMTSFLCCLRGVFHLMSFDVQFSIFLKL